MKIQDLEVIVELNELLVCIDREIEEFECGGGINQMDVWFKEGAYDAPDCPTRHIIANENVLSEVKRHILPAYKKERARIVENLKKLGVEVE